MANRHCTSCVFWFPTVVGQSVSSVCRLRQSDGRSSSPGYLCPIPPRIRFLSDECEILNYLRPNERMEVPAGLNSGARSTLPMDELESPLWIGGKRCLDLESGLFYFKNWESGTRSYVPPVGDGKFCTPTAAECLQLRELAVASDRTTTPFKELELFPLSSNSASLARDGPRQRQVRSRDLFKSKCTSPRSSSSSSSASSVNFRGDGVEKDRAKVRDSRKRKRLGEDDMRLENTREWSRAMVLAGCPRCLMYVMFCKSNRRCPNCGHVFLGHQGIISFEP